MKIDSFHQIQLGSVYKGLSRIDDEEVLQIYNGCYVPQKLIRANPGEVIHLFVTDIRCELILLSKRDPE